MGLAALILLYGVTAALLAGSVRLAGQRATPLIALFLSLLPLVYTAAGFLPRRALAPTPMLSGVAPWADPDLMAKVSAGATATNRVLLDPVSQTIPWSRAARDGLLFNPAQGAGAALLGNGQSAALFPTEAASRLLQPFRAVTYSQAARLLVAAWGMFLLVRLAGFSEAAASASAAIFVGSGFMQLWRLHAHSLVAATAPWILAAAVALYRAPGPGTAALFAGAGAVAVAGGHPETLLHVLLFAAFVVPVLARLEGGPPPQWRRLLGWSGASAVFAFLLAGPALLPFVETLEVSLEWIDRRPVGRTNVETSLDDALDRLRPAAALLALGDPVAGTWRGPENLAELGGGATGSAALLLLVVAVAAGRRRRLLPIALVGLVGLLVASHLPILSIPFGSLPILGDSLLKRLSLWWVLAVAVVAAEGAEILLASTGHRQRQVTGTFLGAAVCVVAIVALAASGSPSEENRRIWTGEGAALLVMAAAVTFMRVKPRDRWGGAMGPSLAAALLLLTALVLPRAELFRSWIPVTPPEGFYPGTPALDVVLRRLHELEPVGYRVTGTEGALVPHSAAFFGLEDFRAYDPMTFSPYHRFLVAVGEPPQPGWVRLLDPNAPFLRFFGVRFIFETSLPIARGENCPQYTTPIRTDRRLCRVVRPHLALAHEGADAVVWERSDSLGRAFFPRTWRAIEDPDSAISTAAEIDNFAALAIVDRAPVATGAIAPVGVTMNAAGVVRRLTVDRGSIEADVTTPAPAILATSQPAIPGWRLTLDAVDAPELLRRINGAFLGVAVPAGRHRVRLRYDPASWKVGLLLAACGAVIITPLVLGDRRGRPAGRQSRIR